MPRKPSRKPKARPAKAAARETGRPFPFFDLWSGMALAALAFIVHIPALKAGFIWDDDQEVTANPVLAMRDGLYRFWFANPTADYFPLKSSIQWIVYQFAGPNPFVFHLLNILMHSVCAVLLWMVLRRLSIAAAWLGAALFAVHPLCVESVAWISELKNTLSFALTLVAMIGFLDFDEKGNRREYAASILAFTMALLSKSAVVPLPFILLLCCYWRRGEIARRDVIRSAPYFLLSLAFGIVTLVFQNTRAIGEEVIPIGNAGERIAGASMALGFYLWKALFPANLMIVYPQWHQTLPIPLQLIPGALLAVLAGFAWRHRATWGRPVLFALGCFIAMLLPVLGFVRMSFMRLTLVSDHFVYYSLGALTALAAGAGARLLSARVLAVAGGILLLGAGTVSWQRAKIFKSSETLWRDTLARNPENWQGKNHYGAVLFMKGNVEEALAHFADAVRLKPDNPECHNNVGLALAKTGRLDEAIEHFYTAVKIRGNHPVIRANLANALFNARRTAEAVPHYRASLQLGEDFAVRANLVQALLQLGDVNGAKAELAPLLDRHGNKPVVQQLKQAIEQRSR
jgi:tetratricopeptide (TPR) repeat protein